MIRPLHKANRGDPRTTPAAGLLARGWRLWVPWAQTRNTITGGLTSLRCRFWGSPYGVCTSQGPWKQNCPGHWALFSCLSWHVRRRCVVPWGGLCEEPLRFGPSPESLSRVLGLGSHCCPSRNCSVLFVPGCPEDSARTSSQGDSDPWERKASLHAGAKPGAGYRDLNVTKVLV